MIENFLAEIYDTKFAGTEYPQTAFTATETVATVSEPCQSSSEPKSAPAS